MFSMGKMKPESRKAGSTVVTMASWLASSWLLVMMLSRMPKESAPNRNSIASPASSPRLPRSGTSKDELADTDAEDQVQHTDAEIGRQLAEDQLQAVKPAWR